MASLQELYGTPGDPSKLVVKTFTLPVSGSVALAGPEVAVVGTPEFQRLTGVKQLGTSYVVFRGALHTRFEHCLGSLHKAELMLRAIERNPRTGITITPTQWRLGRLGALLHDLPHVPFGHTLEDEFHLLARHDQNSERTRVLLKESAIGDILRDDLPNGEYDQLIMILEAKEDRDFIELGELAFIADIVGNTVCADLLDYVERDLNACGLPVAIGERFLDYLTVTGGPEVSPANRNRIALNLDKRGMPRPDVESEVIKVLMFRYELAERVYFHHAKNAASVMIARAVQEAGFAVGPAGGVSLDRNFHFLSDEALLLALAHPQVAEAFGMARHRDHSEDGVALAADLARGVRGRSLYKIAYLAVHDDVADRVAEICENYGKEPSNRSTLEDELAASAGLPAGHVLVHIPRQRMMQKEARVRVRTEAGGILTLEDWDEMHSGRVKALNIAHQRLWRLTVYVHPGATEAQVRVLRAAAKAHFRAESRYVERSTPPTDYLRAVFDEEATRKGWNLSDWPAASGQGVAALDMGQSYDEAVDAMETRVMLAREQRQEPGPG
ncbi:MAG: HD domain-containing protein [Acidimicrobiales bacterium]